ncbi:MAG: NAD-dependent succinate-semialdehyde dehydrogenase [Myxococcota bacterium]
MAIETVNPATGELVKRFDELTDGELDKRLEKAVRAFGEWRNIPFSSRGELMKKAGGILRAEKKRLGEIITLEMGKPITQSIAEVEKCAWVCDFYAESAETMLSKREIATDAKLSYVQYDPIGVVLAVMPWNFPFWQVFRFAAPALMAGNVGVLKHASNVPHSALAIEGVFAEAGFPTGVFTTLLISAQTAERVIRDARIKAVTLTGSEPAGRSVASIAGESLKKSVLELGGSDPFIVLADADLEKAAKTGALARCINSGQTCIAAKRFIVEKEVIAEFAALFKKSLAALKVGDPMDEKTDVGPLARDDLRRDLRRQVTASIEKGAKLELEGEIPEGEGFFHAVSLISAVKPGMPAFDEETFGPVAALIEARDAAEAIALANASAFGLGASLWTRDLERAERLAREIESGSVFVNGLVKSDPRLPFGGVKNSGYGRELSEEGIREFVNIKTVWMAE